jgi:hypothetical protein
MDPQHLNVPTNRSTTTPDENNCFKNDVIFYAKPEENVHYAYIYTCRFNITLSQDVHSHKIMLQAIKMSNMLISMVEFLNHINIIKNMESRLTAKAVPMVSKLLGYEDVRRTVAVCLRALLILAIRVRQLLHPCSARLKTKTKKKH